MPQDKVKEAYELISDLGYFKDENDFRSYVNTPKGRKEAFELLSETGYFKDENDFNSYFEQPKPKQQASSQFGVFKQGVGQSVIDPPAQPKAPTPKPVKTLTLEEQKKKDDAAFKKRFDELQSLGRNPAQRIKLYSETQQRIKQRIPLLVEQFNLAEQSGNVEEAQRLQEEINFFSDKINTYDKAIQGQKQLAAMTEPDTVANQLNISMQRAIGAALTVPETIDKTVKTLLIEAAGLPEGSVELYMKNVYPIEKPLEAKLASVGKLIVKTANERTADSQVNRKFDASGWNALKNGDVATAAEYGFKDFSNNFITSLMYMNPAGATVASVGMLGQEMSDLEEQGVNLNAINLTGLAGKVSLELVTERMFGAGKAGVKLINMIGKDAAERVVKETTQEIVKKSLPREVVENIGEEIVSEEVNTIGSNAIDIYVNKTKKPDQLFEGVGETFVTTLFGGGFQGGLTTTLNHYIDRAKAKQFQAQKDQAIQLQEQALEAPNEAVAKAIENQAAKLNVEADKIAEEQNEIGANADPAIVEELTQVNIEIDELEAALPEAPPEIQEAIQAQIEEKEKEAKKLTNEARISALERMKVADQEIAAPMEEIPTGETEQVQVEQAVEPVESDNKEDAGLNIVTDEFTQKQSDSNIVGSDLAVGEMFDGMTIPAKGDKVLSDIIISIPVNMMDDKSRMIINPAFFASDFSNAIKSSGKSFDDIIFRPFKSSVNDNGTLPRAELSIGSEIFSSTKNDISEQLARIPRDARKSAIVLIPSKFVGDKSNSATFAYSFNGKTFVFTGLGAENFSLTTPRVLPFELLGADGTSIHNFLIENIPQRKGNKLIDTTKDETIIKRQLEQSRESERKGVTEQKQGEQEDRVNQEEPITKGQASPSDSVSEGGQEQEVIGDKKYENGTTSFKIEKPNNIKEDVRGNYYKYVGDNGDVAIYSAYTRRSYDQNGKELPLGYVDNVLIRENKKIFDLNNKKEVKNTKLLEVIEKNGDGFSIYDVFEIVSDTNNIEDIDAALNSNLLKKFSGLDKELNSRKQYLQRQSKNQEVETPIKNYWKSKVDSIDTKKSFTDISQLEVGDVVIDKSGSIGFVKKINPKKVIVETTYGGYGDSDAELMELSFNKSDIKEFKKPDKKAKADAAISFLENLKADTKGKMNAFGVAPAAWNAIIDTLILGIKAGKEIKALVQEAVESLKQESKDFDEKAFKDMLIEGGVATEEELVEEEQPEPEPEPKGPKPKGPKPKEEKVEPTKGTRRHFTTLQNSKELSAIAKRLDEADFFYEQKSMESDRDAAVAYIEKHGLEQAYNDIISGIYAKDSDLTESEKVAMAALVQASISKSIELAESEGDAKTAEEYFKLGQPLADKIAKLGTEYGRAINAFKQFYLDFSNPITAVFNAQMLNSAVNRKIMEDETSKANAAKDAKDVQKDVEKGKKKTAKEVAKKVDEMIYGVITKGQKGLTKEQKAKVKSVFDSFKVDPNSRALSKVAPIKEIVAGLITPKLYNEFVDKVGDLAVEGISLSVAMTRVSTDFIKNKIASPKEMVAARKALSEQVNGLKEKKEPTQLQKDKKAASEELKAATEAFNEKEKLEKELENERNRLADLREKDAKRVLEEVEKLELQRIRESIKQKEKAVEELVGDISKNNQDLVLEIVDEYIAMTDDSKTNNQKVIDMVKNKLGLDDAQAKIVATEIINGVAKNVKEKITKKYGKAIDKTVKKNKKEKTTDDYINEMVMDASLGKLAPEKMMQEFFAEKYGINDFTKEDADNVKAIAREIAESGTPERKAEKIAKMKDYLAEKNPVTFAELMDELWYFARLSSVLTFVTGTADVNNTYNLVQLGTNLFEMPIVSVMQKIRQKDENVVDVFRDILFNAAYAIFQRFELKEGSNQTKDNFLKAIQAKNFLKEAITYYQEAIVNGLAPFAEVEKPFENLRASEFDIKRYFDLAKKGDKDAKAKIVSLMSSVVNSAFRGVPRVLGASDLFFGSIVKSAYVPILLREKLYKDGLRGKELRAKVYEAMVMNAQQVQDAENKAAEMRRTQDITYEMKMEGNTPYWIILDKGKPVKGSLTQGAPVKRFTSQEQAAEYAENNVIMSGTQFKRDVSFFLNENIGRDVIKSAARIAQRDLLSGKTEGFTNTFNQRVLSNFDRWANDSVTFLTKASKDMNSKEFKAIYEMMKDKEYKEGAKEATKNIIAKTLKALSVVTKSLGRIVAFRRVALNLVRKSSNYLGLGYARYAMATKYNRSLLGVKYETELSQAEKDKYLAEAITGTFSLLVFSSMVAQLKNLFRGDEDEDKEGKKYLVAEQYKQFAKENPPPELLNFVVNLRKGDVIGSLEFLDRNQRRFFSRTGIIQENSIFEGIVDGKYKYKSIAGDPKYSAALAFATYVNYFQLIPKDDQKKINAVGFATYQPLSTFVDLSIGQGVGKFLSSKGADTKFEAIAQLLILDNLELFNPDIIKKPLQFLDGKYRPNQNLFDFVEASESVLGGLGQYAVNKITPIYGAVYSATKAPQAYGMFGEELYRLPAQSQGMLAGALSDYLYSDKNLREKAMYDWLAANGYKTIWAAPKEIPVVDGELKLKELTKEEVNLYGIEGGRRSLEELTRRMGELQDIRLGEDGEDQFKREVNKIFGKNFRNAYFEGKKLVTAEQADRLRLFDIAELAKKNEKRIEKKAADAAFSESLINEYNITGEEIALMNFVKENKRARKDIILQYINIKNFANLAETRSFINRVLDLKIISKNDANELEDLLIR